MNTLGRHLLVELWGCDPERLNDPEHLRRWLRDAAEAAGAHVVAEVIHPYAPHGVTGVVVVEESHLSIHTWPEGGYAAVDFYSCGNTAIERAVDMLARAVAATKVEYLEVSRGIEGSADALSTTRRGRLW